MISTMGKSMPCFKVLAFALVIALIVAQADARVYKGTMKTKNDWQYVAKFCYSGTQAEVIGKLNWNIPSPLNPNRKLLLYWDQPNTNKQGSWNHVYKNNKLTCAEKSDANSTAQGGQFDLLHNPSGTHDIGNRYPHYWWAVIADCGASSQNVNYRIEFLQQSGSELSCDEKGMPGLYITFFVFYLVVVGAHAYSAWQLFRTEALHPVVRLVSVTIALQFFSILFYMIHYTTLQRNGVGIEGLKAFADLLNMLMDLSIVLIMILVSKGWAVTTNVIPKRDATIILVLMALLTVLYLALFIWDYATADSAITYYFYQSAPGIIILVIRMLIGVWFLWNVYQTLKFETLPEKRHFYVRWAIAFGSWIVLLPLIVLIWGSQHVWLRLMAISVLQELVDFAILIFLIVHTWPSLARRYFSVMPGKTLLGYDFLSGESSTYAGARNPVPTGAAPHAADNPFRTSEEL